jgi:ATP-binding protein involved in chromosome partitioning
MFPGIIENMAYFTPEELPDKVLFFGKKEQKLSRRFRSPILRGIPIVQSIREAGDYGRPAAMQTASAGRTFSMKSLVMLYKKR